MKLAREFAILFLGCAACAEAASRTAAGATVNLAVLDVPVAVALGDDESDNIPVPADVDDGLAYQDDDASEDAGSDDTVDDVQFKHKRVGSTAASWIAGPPRGWQAIKARRHLRMPTPPIDAMSSNADLSMTDSNVDSPALGEVASVNAGTDEDKGAIDEELTDTIDNVSVRHKLVAQHVRLVDSQPPPIDAMSSNADLSATISNVDRPAPGEVASVNAGADEDEAPIDAESPVQVLPRESSNSQPIADDVVDFHADRHAVMNSNVDREEALDNDAVDEGEAQIHSEVPVEALPRESQGAGNTDTIVNVNVRHKLDAQHVRLVDSQPLPIDVMNSNVDPPTLMNFNPDRTPASVNEGADEDEVPVEALPHESQEPGLPYIPLPKPEEPEAISRSRNPASVNEGADEDQDVEALPHESQEPGLPYIPLPKPEEPEAQEAQEAPSAQEAADTPEPLEAPEAPWRAELSNSEGDNSAAEQDDDGSDSDSYAMMMYLKGRSASVAKDNQRMKDMLTQAAAWGKGVQSTVADLDAERKETESLKGKLRGYRAAKDSMAKELEAERARQKAAESKVKALEYIHEQLVAAQSENAELQHQLDNATHFDEDLRLQLAASQRGVQAAEKSQSTVADQTKSEEEWLMEEAKKMESITVVKKQEEAKLKVAQNSTKTVRKLQKVVSERDKLLRKGLQQLLTEKEHAAELQRQLDSEEAGFTGKLAAEKANATSSLQKLLASKAKVKELKRAVAMTWRMVAQGDKAKQEVSRSMTQAKAELKRVKEGDTEVQAHTDILKHHVAVEKKALQNATKGEQLAVEARDAEQAQLASAKATIEKLGQQHDAVAQQNRELKTILEQTKRAESDLLRDAMGSVSDNGGLNLANLSTPVAQNKTAFVEVAAETSPADLPTLDVVAP